MAGFDLKRPAPVAEWKKTALWAVGALLVGGLIVGGALWFKSKREPQKTRPRVEVAKGFDEAFFAPPPAAAPAAKPEDKPAEVVQKVPELVPVKPGAAAPAPAAPAKPLTARDLFAPPPPTPPQNSLADEFNAARRGSGVVRVSIDPRPPVEEGYTAKQEEWGESKTVASFPVALERVIPVTRRISAVVIESIHSELEGKITAQIEENIYGQHGRNVLIPAGSLAVGRFKPLGKAGETRIPVAWSRIITPDGINITVGNAEMADAMGRTGITGDVDSKFFDRYGMALLISTLSAVTAYNIPVQNQGQAIVIQTYGNNLNQLSSQILEKNINIKPVVTIPAGSRVLISPTKDIWFKKPEKQEVQVVAYQQEGAKR